jgi:hypothetical protein
MKEVKALLDELSGAHFSGTRAWSAFSSCAIVICIIYRQRCWFRPFAVLSAASEYGVRAKRNSRAPAGE